MYSINILYYTLYSAVCTILYIQLYTIYVHVACCINILYYTLYSAVLHTIYTVVHYTCICACSVLYLYR